jgi:hypothetical protein
MGIAEEVICGDRKDPNNVFHWDKVVLDLPGSNKYEPNNPLVYKLWLDYGRSAANLFIFVDDLCPIGPSEK